MPAAKRQAGRMRANSGAQRHRTIHQGGVSDIDACTQGIPATRLMASQNLHDTPTSQEVAILKNLKKYHPGATGTK